MKSGQQVRVGVIAVDPLRAIGLQAILEEGTGLVVSAVGLDEAIVSQSLTAVLVDAAGVESVPGTLVRFRRERPAVKVIVFGDELAPDRIQAMVGAGAKGYLADGASEAEIRTAVQVVLDGSVWAPRKVLAKLIEAGEMTFAPGETAERCRNQMTGRERTVLQLLMDGRTNRQIAETMGIEQVTVKAHVGRMMRKAGVSNRVELTLKALGAVAGEGE